MTVIGFHASHEQVHPAALLDAVRHAEEAGFTAAMCSDHFSPWSERQGHSGFAWSWLGAALATTRLPFGVVNAPGQRYHPAIVAQAIATLGRDVPRPVLGGAGHRRGVQRAHHRRRLAAQGGPRRPAARVRRRHPRAARRRGGQPRRPGHGRPGPALDPARRAAGADRRRRVASRPPRGWPAGPTAWSPSTSRPDQLREMVAAYRERRRPRAGRACRCTCPARPTTTRRSPIAHDQWRSNVFAPPVCWDLDTVERVRRGRRARADPRTCAASVLVSGDPGQHAAWLAGARRPRLRRDLPAPRRPGAAGVPRRVRRAGAAAAGGRRRP